MIGQLPFVGRTNEFAALKNAAITSQSIIVSGEAGSGKSRLVSELAGDPDVTCLIGTCAPELRGSPYAAFVSVAMKASKILDPTALEWPQRLLNDLGVLFPSIAPDQDADDRLAPERRHGLWLAMLRYLDALAITHPRPVALIVEDMHAADGASLSLFDWLAAETTSFAMIGTSRPDLPAEVVEKARIVLGPLDLDSVNELRSVFELAAVDAEAIWQLTSGNPLRLHELMLAAQVDPTNGQDALRGHVLDRLDETAVEVLELAAVMGSEIDARFVAEGLGRPETEVVEDLRATQALGVLVREAAGSWTFAHESYRDSMLARLEPHRKREFLSYTAGVLRPMAQADPSLLGHLAAIAVELGEDHGEAADLYMAAGQYANAQLAPQNAIAHFEMALELAEMANEPTRSLEAKLSLGICLAATGDKSATAVLWQVYELADDLNNGESFARAALAEPVNLGAVAVPMTTDHRIVARLRDALTRADNESTKAELLVALALQQHGNLVESDYFELVDRAQRIADDLGDPVLHNQVFGARFGVRRPAGTLAIVQSEVQQRIDALEPFDPMSLPVIDLGVTVAFRCGKLRRAAGLVSRYESEFSPLPLVARWSILRARAALALARGLLSTAEELAGEAVGVTAGTRLEEAAFTYFGFQTALRLREEGRLDEVLPLAEQWVQENPDYLALRAARAWMRAESGQTAAARSDLEEFFAADLQELRGRVEGAVSIAMAISGAAVVESVPLCTTGHAMLLPYQDEWLVVGEGTAIIGPVVRVLALASSVVGETDRALEENLLARRSAQRAGASLYVWHAIRDRGLILQRAGRNGEAIEAFDDAAARYKSAGLSAQADYCSGLAAELRTMVAPASVSSGVAGASAPASYRRVGKLWHVNFDGESAKVRHLKGMPMIAALLAVPGHQMSAAQLADIGEGGHGSTELTANAASAGPQAVLDDESVQRYRRRLDDIRAELDRADRRGNVEKSQQLTDEHDALIAELKTATGLGQRRRAMSDESERARVRVTKSIRSAIRRIGERAPNTAAYLDRSITTGVMCGYQPDPRHPVHWQL